MIEKIIMYRMNGMYTDEYDVKYIKPNGYTFWRRYKIKGEMINKHFKFLMEHSSKSIYSKNGKHVQDTWE